jgi:DNA-binding transcriptional MerR regulator
MYSIGEFAKKFKSTTRALRLYEEKGLLIPSYRGENGYRFYHQDLGAQIEKIQRLKSLGFSLEDIKQIKELDSESLSHSLLKRLSGLDKEIDKLGSQRIDILNLLSVSKKINDGSEINPAERRVFMDGVREEVIEGLSQRVEFVSERHLEFIDRDKEIYNSPEKIEFINAVKKCVAFAKQRNLLMGPGRGSGPASIIMYALGFSGIDPTENGIIPERLIKDTPDLHIDVEFERGQEFVDYCKAISKNLTYGQINAFKMPLLNIIENVEKRIVKKINYDDYSEDTILEDIRNGDIQKIFCLDISKEALVWKYENFLPGYGDGEKLKKYLNSQKIHSYSDLLNIIALWRPNTKEKIKRAELYKERKEAFFEYDFLSPTLKQHLRANFGQIIYHEDIIKIIKEYTPLTLDECNIIRRDLFKNTLSDEGHKKLLDQMPKNIYELVVIEAPNTFCRTHMIAFSTFIKKTAILKNIFKDLYYEEIEKWEKEYGFKWDDIGIKLKGVSLLQN